MTPDRKSPSADASGKSRGRIEREAGALRENLRKRKAQAAARAAREAAPGEPRRAPGETAPDEPR